jgi:predicted kinase
MTLKKLILTEVVDNAELIIIRGVPGSGKSTYANKHFKSPEYKIFEADDYFGKGKNYKFDVSKIGEAHRICFENVKKRLEAGKKVVVSNTFVKLKEIKPYIDLGKKLGKATRILRMSGSFKSVHRVPDEKVEEMKKNFVNVNGEVKV